MNRAMDKYRVWDEEKKEYVIDFLQSKGFNLNNAEIENLIESAVLKLKK